MLTVVVKKAGCWSITPGYMPHIFFYCASGTFSHAGTLAYIPSIAMHIVHSKTRYAFMLTHQCHQLILSKIIYIQAYASKPNLILQVSAYTI